MSLDLHIKSKEGTANWNRWQRLESISLMQTSVTLRNSIMRLMMYGMRISPTT